MVISLVNVDIISKRASASGGLCRRFCTEASQLRFPVGYTADELVLEGEKDILRFRHFDANHTAIYTDTFDTIELMIFND